jgi:DNA-directed RNA polymerase beta subunit
MTDQGYFIIDGSEKVVIIQETRLPNEPFTYITQQREPCCELFVESAHVPVKVKMEKNSVIVLDTSMIRNNIRNVESIGMFELLFTVFNSNVQYVDTLTNSYCRPQRLRDACMTYIVVSTKGTGGLVPDEDREMLRKKMFGNMNDDLIVATLVTMIVSCVSVHLKYDALSDRNDYTFKCLKTPGETVYKIFKYCVASCKAINKFRGQVEKNVHGFIKRGETTIGKRIYSKLAVQFSRRSIIDELSCVRKVVIPCDENSPNLIMRQIHSSQKGYICPCETPEGKSVGITKSLACCCLISTKTDVREWIAECCETKIANVINADFAHARAPVRVKVWVIVDGAVAGWCNPINVRSLKSRYPTVSVTSSKHNVVKIRTVAGRPIRPLLSVKHHPVDWDDPDVVYLDPVECSSATIASVGYEGDWMRFTHMEIHPCTMLGLAASLVPFPEHNQSARNVFTSAMVKQAMQMDRSRDKSCDTLQKPLVYTTVGREVGYDDDPNGVNLVVCIMCINGFNQEDAIIVKRSSVDRGMFSSVAKHTTTMVVNNPWKMVGTPGDAFVIHGGTEKIVAEVNSMLSSPTLVSVNEHDAEQGRSNVQVTMMTHRTLELGDKLSSRHGQKGVVGLLMNDEDMPFNKDGMVPDIIINPHAIPSRMTVGQLIESAMGKSAAKMGRFVDGTPFVRQSIGEITAASETETMTLGTTGEVVETPVTMGIVYYMALKHQAADKAYVRSSGPKSIMSRQPISGRSKGGGLRFGEMEYDCLIAHGASKMITEVSKNSDMVYAPYCDKCNIVTDVLDGNCRFCGSNTVRKCVPFSYVVLKDMLLSANVQLQTEL